MASLATGATAQNGTYYQTGNALYDDCQKSTSTPSNIFLFAYIEGVVDGRQFQPDGYCIPTSVQAQQLRDVVCKSLEHNPQDRQTYASILVIRALRDAWPCQ